MNLIWPMVVFERQTNQSFFEVGSYISYDAVAGVLNGLKCGKPTDFDDLLNKFLNMGKNCSVALKITEKHFTVLIETKWFYELAKRGVSVLIFFV